MRECVCVISEIYLSDRMVFMVDFMNKFVITIISRMTYKYMNVGFESVESSDMHSPWRNNVNKACKSSEMFFYWIGFSFIYYLDFTVTFNTYLSFGFGHTLITWIFRFSGWLFTPYSKCNPCVCVYQHKQWKHKL